MNKEKFSILIIPDTQEICRIYPEILEKMYQSMYQNYKKWNAKKILHLGDIVNDGSKDENQYIMNLKHFDNFDKLNLPYLISIGNHDYDNLVSLNRDSLMFNKHFGINRYKDKTWFKGSFENNKSDNIYSVVEIGKEKYLFLSLEFGPRDEVIKWANSVIEKYKNTKTFIITHSHIYIDGTHTTIETKYNAKLYSGLDNANNGVDIWNKLLKNHNNILAVFSGHHVGGNISYRFDTSTKNKSILQAFFNWQYDLNGGEGRFILMEVEKEKFTFNVYNPMKNNFENKFELSPDVFKKPNIY